MSYETDVIIIGAGAAGIGAARRLLGSGLNVVLVEALPRLGGRAWTLQAAGVALDMGCAYLHSAERNPWVPIAEAAGVEVDRSRPGWSTFPLGPNHSPQDNASALAALMQWSARTHGTPPASDCAADLLDPADARWIPYIQARCGYYSGNELERLSVRDLAAYDAVATDTNWRLPAGYGALITSALPRNVDVHLDTPVEAVTLGATGVELRTAKGSLRARAAIVTVSSTVLAGDSIAWPAELAPWREAAAGVPLGNDEKLYFQILDGRFFEAETHYHGDPGNPASGSYYVRPHGKPVIECFLGGAGARAVAEQGAEAAFVRATEELVGIFGADVQRHLRPLVASDWTNTGAIGGSYSHALPGKSALRARLAQPFDDRLFLAGEATHANDFSTAHGALMSGQRAAEEALAALAG